VAHGGGGGEVDEQLRLGAQVGRQGHADRTDAGEFANIFPERRMIRPLASQAAILENEITGIDVIIVGRI
jgi:hypothetical protein